jgi:hypothetical protein
VTDWPTRTQQLAADALKVDVTDSAVHAARVTLLPLAVEDPFNTVLSAAADC